MDTKFRVHYDKKEGGRDTKDVIASGPQEAADTVRHLKQDVVIVKVKRVKGSQDV